MTPTDWGVFAALVSTALVLILPWMMKVHAKLAVAFAKLQALDSRLAVIDRKLDQILDTEHHRAVNEAVWENRLQALEAHFTDELPS